MIRVRFSTGLVIQYNEAMWVDRTVIGVPRLFTGKNGTVIAAIQDGFVLEYAAPCRVYRDPGDAIERLTRDLRRERRVIRELRKAAKGR